MVTLDLYVTNFELLFSEIEASIPSLMRDLEHICPGPSTFRGLSEVHIHKLKGLCHMANEHFRITWHNDRKQGRESAVPNLIKRIITLTSL